MKQELLSLRIKIKSKKPKFIRQDAHKKAEISKKWIRPKGIHSKMRHNFKGYRRSVSSGWGSPKKVRGLHKSGLKMVNIHSLSELERIDKGNEGIIIGKDVGLRKRLLIVKEAANDGIKILNIRDVNQFIKDSEEQIKKKKEEKIKEGKERKEKIKEKEEKIKEKKELVDKIEKEEEKIKEKKEKDKILTKKDSM
ncbi:50S ribosomal protein L32e [Candidatus Woesearchaeota archaeon]|nr:50S ribosomal protein L32e [Candidatus Woesearchaeota archaeon]